MTSAPRAKVLGAHNPGHSGEHRDRPQEGRWQHCSSGKLTSQIAATSSQVDCLKLRLIRALLLLRYRHVEPLALTRMWKSQQRGAWVLLYSLDAKPPRRREQTRQRGCPVLSKEHSDCSSNAAEDRACLQPLNGRLKDSPRAGLGRIRLHFLGGYRSSPSAP